MSTGRSGHVSYGAMFMRLRVLCAILAMGFQSLAACGKPSALLKPAWADAELETLPVHAVLESGMQEALLWRSDAIMVNADFDLAPFSEALPLSAFLGFVSGDEGKEWLLVRVYRSASGALAARQVGTGIHGLPRNHAEPIEYGTQYVSIYDAIAYSIEGARTEELEEVGTPDWPATAELAHRDRSGYKGSPVWVVTFQNRATSTALHITVDATTGEVLDTTLY